MRVCDLLHDVIDDRRFCFRACVNVAVRRVLEQVLDELRERLFEDRLVLPAELGLLRLSCLFLCL